ncbi:DNA-binding transcriptional regulator, LysR family [Bosea sp. OK403]|uniref:LysR substrate-binding domain-containing protein n=1 Tax=Bosea sp. OK403 TaxID=1855286 RepID=UPI0008F1AC1F|nr:LysR substrate-binding domain-containing protein [Bosea sp. OK403]SFJ92138.1 DNA-binding transcriptional regulator, LysR family [Bosea sp. OK403]
MVQLPSIQSLRAFEAAFRWQSYSRAGDELGLTHGAVSHRIRDLEARTGHVLFRRVGNEMLPTDEARRLMLRVREALAILNEAFASPLRDRARRTIKLSVLPSFASRWLVPRLNLFRDAHPEIAIELDSRLDHAELGPSGVDAAIRYGPGGWPGLRAEPLARETLLAVCAPRYRERLHLASTPDILRCVLLRHSWQPWAPWLRAAGLPLKQHDDGPGYADAGLLIDAAIAGEGVALARGILVKPEIAAGRLVALGDVRIRDEHAYHLVRPLGTSRLDPAIDAFRDWMVPLLRADALSVER